MKYGFMLLHMEVQYSGADLPDDMSATPFFSLITHPSAASLSDTFLVSNNVDNGFKTQLSGSGPSRVHLIVS